mgnify:CR=1 FL=1
MRFSGQGLMSHTSTTTISRFFEKSRGKALSTIWFGLSSAEFVLPVLVTYLFVVYSWRSVWQGIAIIIITLKGLLNAQDSLYWFDMSKVRDSIPYTPKVLDKVFGTSQLKILDSLKNIQVSTREGFRLQIFESSSADEANRVLKKFNKGNLPPGPNVLGNI